MSPPILPPCTYCGRQTKEPWRLAKASLTRDHVIPRSQGGRTKVPACRICNHLKGDMLPAEWRRVMAAFPTWWKRFHTHKELRLAWAAHQKAEAARKAEQMEISQ